MLNSAYAGDHQNDTGLKQRVTSLEAAIDELQTRPSGSGSRARLVDANGVELGILRGDWNTEFAYVFYPIKDGRFLELEVSRQRAGGWAATYYSLPDCEGVEVLRAGERRPIVGLVEVTGGSNLTNGAIAIGNGVIFEQEVNSARFPYGGCENQSYGVIEVESPVEVIPADAFTPPFSITFD